MLANRDEFEVRAKIEEVARPKISIIVPVYNMESYLHQCLDTAVGQTLEDIEVICVDDHSSDASPAILSEYAQRDPRVRVITLLENRGESQARKEGVSAATGEYFMFLDADDGLELHACEKLSEEMSRAPVDILHFGTIFTNESTLSAKRIEWLRRFLQPHDGVLEDDDIFECAFGADRLYNFTIWDKLYSADLCKRSFACIKDGRFPRAADKYAYFILSYFARSYRGLPDERLYHYYFGRGVTGHNLVSLKQFESVCSMGLVADAMKEFLVGEGTEDRFERPYTNARDELLEDCTATWGEHLAVEDRAAGYSLMFAYWDPPEVIAKIAELNWAGQGHIARVLKESRSVAWEPREVRVVGTYYHSFENGGAERNLSILIKLWQDLGYRVVLFTDLPPSAHDYDLPEGVDRVVLPSFYEVKPGNYRDRASEFDRAIREHGIDVMVYHAWVSPILLWDLLLCKAAGVAFITHCHSVFAHLARSVSPYFADMPDVYHLCDAIVALSEVDRAYWTNFNPNVTAVVNPLTFDLEDLEVSSLEDKNVLWLGRISKEKRPEDALMIFAKVLEAEPDAKLFMVGSCTDRAYLDRLYELMDELRIRDAVVMSGFHKHVLPFYGLASVLLMTSESEGFSLVLAEGQSAGVPCVMYELPYLTLTRPRKGLIAVELGDLNAAADGVVELLCDLEYRRSLGREARANVEDAARFDFAGTWRAVFDGLAAPATDRPVDETARIMWETLLEHYRAGAVLRNLEMGRRDGELGAARSKAARGDAKIRKLEKKIAAAQSQQKKLRRSWSYRIGHAIMWAPRMARKLLRRMRAV
jgi:glycosyltransferase involved in cell wall biosynthesis